MINSKLTGKEFPVFLQIKMNVVVVQHVMLYVLKEQFGWR